MNVTILCKKMTHSWNYRQVYCIRTRLRGFSRNYCSQYCQSCRRCNNPPIWA